MTSPINRRFCFISATYLSRTYQNVPAPILRDCLLFFGSKRSWVFPQTKAEKADADRQPTDYSKFPEEFKRFILEKEAIGHVFWLKPECDFNKVSNWLTGIKDTFTGENYRPLILDEDWWKNTYNVLYSDYKVRWINVVRNFKTGEHGYEETIELLVQSNPSLIVRLYP